MALEHGQQAILERQVDRPEVRRALRLGIHADGTPEFLAKRLRQLDHLVERRHVELPVEHVRPECEPLFRPQGLDLRQREVFREPAGDVHPVDLFCPLAIRKLHRDVRRAANFVFMPGDQDAVLRRHQIRFDEVGAHLGREPVRRERVLGPMPAGAAMPDDQGMRRRHDAGGDHGHRRREGRNDSKRVVYHRTLTPSCICRAS